MYKERRKVGWFYLIIKIGVHPIFSLYILKEDFSLFKMDRSKA